MLIRTNKKYIKIAWRLLAQLKRAKQFKDNNPTLKFPSTEFYRVRSELNNMLNNHSLHGDVMMTPEEVKLLVD